MTTLADALTGGSQYVKWEELGVGHSVTGTITDVDMRQARKFQSTDLDFWDDGKPKMQVVISIQTAERDDPEDDGLRSVAINLWSGQKKALVEACQNANVDEPKVGQQFTATWSSGVGKTGNPRVFTYSLGAAPSGVGAALGTVATATGEVTPPAAAAAAPAPQIDAAAAAAALANLTPEQRAALGL